MGRETKWGGEDGKEEVVFLPSQMSNCAIRLPHYFPPVAAFCTYFSSFCYPCHHLTSQSFISLCALMPSLVVKLYIEQNSLSKQKRRRPDTINLEDQIAGTTNS